MRFKLFSLIALITLFATPVIADQYFNTAGAELGHFTKIQCAAGLNCSQVSGRLEMRAYPDQIASSTTTLTAAQCGSTIVSNSADVVTLPEASTVLGCRYTFVCGTADDFDVNPFDGTDQIGVLNSVAAGTSAAITPSAGDAVRCTDIGSSFVLEAVGANLWAAIGTANGAITDVN